MTGTAHPKTVYRPDIDGLRAVAVGIVVLFHAFPAWLTGGYVGVDVFFVISGYLISGILFAEMEAGTYNILQFYYRRFRRIFPALLLVMLASLAYGRFFIWPHQYLELAKEIAAGAGFVANLLFWSQSGYFDQSASLKPMLHLWSLGIEEQFYIVWPLLLLALRGQGRTRLRGLILVLMLLSFGYSLYELQHDQTGAFYSPLPRFWELLAGAMIAALPRLPDTSGMIFRHGASLLGLALIAVAAVTYSEASAFPGFLALVPVAGSALVLLAGPQALFNRLILSSKPFVAIGLISYPLYLWHWPVFVFLHLQVPEPGAALMAGAVGLAVVFATATYWLLEKPLRRVEARVLFARLSLSMAAVLAFSLATLQFQILMHPLTLTEKLQFPYDTTVIYRYKTCFLYPKTQDAEDFAPECDPPAKPGQSKVLIWGDSLGAELYSGLKALADRAPQQSLVIAQRTAGSCPPGTEADHSENGHCDSINRATRDWIVKNRPSIVVLNARWLNNGREPEARLPEVAAFLKGNGVERIILFGPAPDWWPDLRQLLAGMNLSGDQVPERMPLPLLAWKNTLDLDARLSEIARSEGIGYVSVKDAFCDGDQCLVRVSDDVLAGLITSDHDHMTKAASEFLFSRPDVAGLFSRD